MYHVIFSEVTVGWMADGGKLRERPREGVLAERVRRNRRDRDRRARLNGWAGLVIYSGSAPAVLGGRQSLLR